MRMKVAALVSAASLVAIVTASTADITNRVQFPMAGYSIAPLDASPGSVPSQSLMMFLPASGAFAPNVNVQVQPYSGSITNYAELTFQQLKDHDGKLLEKKFSSQAVVFEYTGDLGGHILHWYARAEKSGDHIYLATATATEEQWPGVAKQLKACVDSLRSEPAVQSPAKDGSSKQ